MKDPFSLVFSALWEMAESSEPLTSQVRLNNRVKYDLVSLRQQPKPSTSAADLPELVLNSEGAGGNMRATSSSGMMMRRYSWVIQTGDPRITEFLLPVEWALWAAMNRWCEVLPALKWNDKSFVTNCNILEIVNGQIQVRDVENAPVGWAAVWGINVEMHFKTSDLILFSKGEL